MLRGQRNGSPRPMRDNATTHDIQAPHYYKLHRNVGVISIPRSIAFDTEWQQENSAWFICSQHGAGVAQSVQGLWFESRQGQEFSPLHIVYHRISLDLMNTRDHFPLYEGPGREVPGYTSRGPGSIPELPHFLRSSGSGTGSTQPREYN
jgi:hypothetical protein